LDVLLRRADEDLREEVRLKLCSFGSVSDRRPRLEAVTE